MIRINNVRFRIVHGSPDSISELIFPIDKKDRFIEIMTSLEEDILICGHCHQQWDYKVGEKHAVNPGSAGAQYLINRD